MIAEKKCKGTGKAKGHGCGKFVATQWRKYGLGIQCCWSKWLLNTPAGQEFLKKTTFKVTEPRRSLEKTRKDIFNTKKLETLKVNCRNAVHNYIKERDKGKPCISCSCGWHENFQAGHYYKAELYSALKFNFHNINGQCVQCNVRLEGNLNDYALNLPKKIGQNAFNELKHKAEESKKINFKWDREELILIRAEARKLYKILILDNAND